MPVLDRWEAEPPGSDRIRYRDGDPTSFSEEPCGAICDHAESYPYDPGGGTGRGECVRGRGSLQIPYFQARSSNLPRIEAVAGVLP